MENRSQQARYTPTPYFGQLNNCAAKGNHNCEHYSQSKKWCRGFTLIELLVSMTIFSVVMTMAASSLLVLLDANSKAQNMQAVLNDLTIAIDSMTREIRTGYNYVCESTSQSVESESATDDCTTGGRYLSVVEAGDSLTASAGSNRVSYYYDSTQQAILRRVGDGDGDGNTNELADDWVRLTAANVNIRNAEFIVHHTGTADELQPTVTVYIEGEAGELAGVEGDFVIQTTVTQRPIEL
jgi:prepilin-type N-terminal cleavage/methylation domain-containing protein